MIRPTVVSFLDMMLQERDKNLQVEEIPLPDAFVGNAISALDLRRHPQTSVIFLEASQPYTKGFKRGGFATLYQGVSQPIASKGTNLRKRPWASALAKSEA